MPKTLKLALTALFTALVCIATIMFTVYVPATRGFFNMGETMVYTSALILGPVAGGFAGGIGSMMADLLLGYSYYAPATLVIKACEGAIVGELYRRISRLKLQCWRSILVFMGLIVGLGTASIGLLFYSGEAEIGLLFWNLTINVPLFFWIILGVLTSILSIYWGFRVKADVGQMILSIIPGGIAMISGYYMYESLVLGVAALVEIPINLMQMLVGIIVAVPLARAVKKIYLKEMV